MATNNDFYEYIDFNGDDEYDDEDDDNDDDEIEDEDLEDDYSMDSSNNDADESKDENSKINRLKTLIEKLIDDNQNKLNYPDLLESIQNLLSSNKSKFKDKDGNYKTEIVTSSYKLLDFILLENNEMFSRENCYYSLYFISYYFIPGIIEVNFDSLYLQNILTYYYI